MPLNTVVHFDTSYINKTLISRDYKTFCFSRARYISVIINCSFESLFGYKQKLNISEKMVFRHSWSLTIIAWWHLLKVKQFRQLSIQWNLSSSNTLLTQTEFNFPTILCQLFTIGKKLELSITQTNFYFSWLLELAGSTVIT